MLKTLLLLLALSCSTLVLAAEPAKTPLVIDDLYKLDGPQSVVVAPDHERAAVIRRWVDPDTREERLSLWLADGGPEPAQPLEKGEPDARSPVFAPGGGWIAVRSTRPRPDGWKPTPSVPPESDAATDIWLVSVDGGQSLPLAGPDKPYGRVFNDTFYGRVAFSPDGRFLAFVADDGRDPRTKEEIEADVVVVRPDQGEGYTGYGAAQVWIAELDPQPTEYAAKSIRRLTDDGIWYGDPQWTPDGRQVICHANKSGEVESVRYSINKNFDLWAVDVESGRQRRLTDGPGPEVSPRISLDGSRLVCLSSPRKGPHADVFNLVLVDLSNEADAKSRTLYDHHGPDAEEPPHPVPAYPLPDDCWDGSGAIVYTSLKRTDTETVRLNLATGKAGPLAAHADQAMGVAARLAAQRRLKPEGNAILRERLRAEERIVEWMNDGLKLDGVITLPPPEVAKAPYPVVVHPHGGPHSRSTRGFNFTVQVLAANGYLVFQPNFRGSAGYGRAFLDADRKDLGGGDMRDILTGVEALIEQGLVDRERQFVYGSSYGGFMASWLVGHTRQFRAAVAQNAVTDMNVMWGLSDLQSWTEWELGGKPWEIADAMRRHSPISYAGQVATPTLVLHAQGDRRVPIAMGHMFHQSLLARGVPTQMVVYPNEGHGIRQPKHQADVLRRVLAWFAQHDKPDELRIVTLGDSITKGVRSGVSADETFSALLQEELRRRGIQATVINAGVGGERTDQALKRLDSAVIAHKPHLVTIMYGTNDSYVDIGKSESRISRDAYREGLRELVRRLREAGIEPILMTEPRWGAKARLNGAGEHPNVRLEQYVQACRDVAKQTDTPLVDHFAHWTEREAAGQDLGEWTTDQCHPNPAGHRILLERLLPAALEKAQKPARPNRSS